MDIHYYNMLISNISFLSNNIRPKHNNNGVSLHNAKYNNDYFEYKNRPQNTNIENIYNNELLYFPKNIDLSEAQNIKLQTINSNDFLTMDYDPQRTEFIYDNKARTNIEAVILKSTNPDNIDELGIHIFSKDLKTEYGQVLYSVYNNSDTEGIEEIAIKNRNKNISGLSRIADKYAVQYCTEHNISQNITAYPKPEDYKANFEDGKRFVVPTKGSNQYNFLIKNYHNPDPNKVIQNILVDTSSWPAMKMYLPKNISKKYNDNFIPYGITIYNPMADRSCYTKSPIDISRPKKLDCYTSADDIKRCSVEFDPAKTGQIYDKITGKPVDVFILKLHDNSFKHNDSFHFFSKDLQHEYGFVEFNKDYLNYDFNLKDTYPKENITGERLVVSYLENYDDESYGGIGKLADKVAVKYCIENNIRPNIVSVAGDDSYPAHYSRGKRFIQPEKDSAEYDFLMNTYGTPNPNKVLRELLNKSKQQGQKIDMKDWNAYYFKMFLPKHLVEKYKKEQ